MKRQQYYDIGHRLWAAASVFFLAAVLFAIVMVVVPTNVTVGLFLATAAGTLVSAFSGSVLVLHGKHGAERA